MVLQQLLNDPIYLGDFKQFMTNRYSASLTYFFPQVSRINTLSNPDCSAFTPRHSLAHCSISHDGERKHVRNISSLTHERVSSPLSLFPSVATAPFTSSMSHISLTFLPAIFLTSFLFQTEICPSLAKGRTDCERNLTSCVDERGVL